MIQREIEAAQAIVKAVEGLSQESAAKAIAAAAVIHGVPLDRPIWTGQHVVLSVPSPTDTPETVAEKCRAARQVVAAIQQVRAVLEK